MNFDLSDEQQMLQEGAARYFEKSYDFKMRLERARTGGGFSRATWQEFADMGWLAASVPEAHGGLGFGPIELALIAEEIGRHLALEPFSACAVMPAAILAQVATEPQQAGLLPGIASGEQIVAVAYSEPDARGDLNQIAGTAVSLPDGRWRLQGRKSLVVGAPVADRFLVAMRSGGFVGETSGISLFDVARDTPGFSLEAYSLVDGTPASDLLLDGVIVGGEALLGRAGEAGTGLQYAVDHAIVAQCAEMVGGLEDVLKTCSEYLKTRKQFGVSIGSFQALQHRMADMAIEASQARASLHRGMQALTAGEPERRSVDVSGVKAQVLKSARYVAQQGIQLHGGYGITEEYRVGHHWRRLLLADSVLGSSSFHLGRYAKRVQAEALASSARSNE